MRILVVDDEFVALMSMTTLLAEYGEVDASTHGYQAYEMFIKAILGKKPYELITIDINLPDFDGLQLVNMIHEKEKELIDNGLVYTPCKKVMITAESDKDVILKAVKSRCDSYIIKPVRKLVLVQKLRKIGIILNG